ELGQEIQKETGDELIWRLPTKALFKLRQNGRIIHETTGDQGRYLVETPGVYRVEAYLPSRLFGQQPWIFSNPIYLRP
ncbi:MAG: hypothetical protein HQK55_17300, partial [Deltaproteobacteria bacterium]|nr:hypothetical protein [Deltaproteobacteria bacterium]